MGKNILIVTHGFYPEQSPRAFRATELAKEFCRQGHHVTVVAPWREQMEPLLEEYPIRFISMGKLSWRIPNLKRGGKVGALYNKAVNRLLPLLFEYPMMEVFFKVRKTLSSFQPGTFDLLISIAVPYPIHWGVASVWKKQGNNIARTWVADCGDPYMGQENDTFTPPFYFGWVEKWFMRKADHMAVPVETAIPAYYPEFHSKIKVIPQGFRFADVPKCTTKATQHGPLTMAYAGTLIPGRREPKAFFEFLLQQPREYRLDIFTHQSHLIESYQLRSGGRIRACKPLPRKDLLNKLCEYEVLVNLENAGSRQIPSKLIDYALLNKPILSVSTHQFDPKVVGEFLNRDYRGAMVIKDIEQYDIAKVAQQFLALS